MANLRLAVWLVVGGTIATASVRMGKDIVVTAPNGITRIQITLDGAAARDVSPSTDKCVVDLKGVESTWKNATFAQHVGDSRVNDIRVGAHPDYIRIVVDLAAPAGCTARDATGGLVIEIGGPLNKPTTPPAVAHRPLTAAATLSAPHVKEKPVVAPPKPPGGNPPPPINIPKPASKPPAIDENSIDIAPNFELNIMEDTVQDLPYVLQMYRGYIGFGDTNTRALKPTFSAGDTSDWTPVPLPEGKTSLNDYFALQFTDNRSTVIENLRQKNQIPATAPAYALFPKSFRDVINQQLRHAAAQQGSSARISAATIQFSMANSSGIEVKSFK